MTTFFWLRSFSLKDIFTIVDLFLNIWKFSYLCMTSLEISEASICLIWKKRIHSRFLGIKVWVQKDSKRYYEKNVPKWNQSMYLWRCMHSIKVSSFHYKEHSNMAYFHTPQEWIDFFSFDWNWSLKIFNWMIQIMLLRTFYLFFGLKPLLQSHS